jgi:hypothetical protein
MIFLSVARLVMSLLVVVSCYVGSDKFEMLRVGYRCLNLT